MSNVKEDKAVETRLKEIYECTRHEGWKHIQDMFNAKIAELKNIESLVSYRDEDKLKMMTIHIEVAQRLTEILNQVTAEVEFHDSQTTDQIRIYGADDFTGE